MFRRFRNYPQIGGKKALPYDAEVEYLDGDGMAWIDTGVYGTEKIYVSAKVEFLPPNYSAVFGVRSSAHVEAIYCGRYGGNNYRYSPNYDSTMFSTASRQVSDLNPHIVSFGQGTVTFDDYSESLSIKAFKTWATIPLFGFIASRGGAMVPVQSRIYWFKVDGVIDLIPVRFTNEHGVSEGAMYDRVSGQLFRNQGTGAFVIGPDK